MRWYSVHEWWMSCDGAYIDLMVGKVNDTVVGVVREGLFSLRFLCPKGVVSKGEDVVYRVCVVFPGEYELVPIVRWRKPYWRLW